jgi:hypothetical protein
LLRFFFSPLHRAPGLVSFCVEFFFWPIAQRMLFWTTNPNKYRIARYLAEENEKKGNKVKLPSVARNADIRMLQSVADDQAS